jgi:hypothetical protein
MLLLLGLHTTNLVKGALDARGSKLMPDKKISDTASLVTDLDVVVHVTSLGMHSTYQCSGC